MPRKKKATKATEPKVKEETREPTQEELAQKEDEKRQARVAACSEEVATALQKYGCTLDAAMILRAGQVVPNIQIVPIELMQQNKPA